MEKYVHVYDIRRTEEWRRTQSSKKYRLHQFQDYLHSKNNNTSMLSEIKQAYYLNIMRVVLSESGIHGLE